MVGERWETVTLNGVAIVEGSQPRQNSDSCNKWREIIFAQICVESLCAIDDYRSVGMLILLLSVVDRIGEVYSPEYRGLMHTASSWSVKPSGKREEGTPHDARREFSGKRHRRVFSTLPAKAR